MTREINCGCLFGMTCRACVDVDPRKMTRSREPVERRATVAELDRLLREIVEAVDAFEAEQVDDCSITWRRALDGIEAARYAIGANS